MTNRGEEHWDSLLRSFADQPDKESFLRSMHDFEQKLSEDCQLEATSNLTLEMYSSPIFNLGIPKHNSLTDSMLRCTLGCEQKLAKSYLQILDQNDQSADRQRRVADAKAKFIGANNHKDSSANSRQFKKEPRKVCQRPVIDNEHQAYLKTQLSFLEQPKGQSKIKPLDKTALKEHQDKHSESIARKISELGGIEDTISRMQDSLSRNEVNNFKRKDILKMDSSKQSYTSFNSIQTSPPKDSWLERSKDIRAKLAAKLNIQ